MYCKISAQFTQLKRRQKKQWPLCWEESTSKEPYPTHATCGKTRRIDTHSEVLCCEHSLYIQHSNFSIQKSVWQTCRNNLSCAKENTRKLVLLLFPLLLRKCVVIYMYLLLCLGKLLMPKLICAWLFIKEFHKYSGKVGPTRNNEKPLNRRNWPQVCFVYQEKNFLIKSRETSAVTVTHVEISCMGWKWTKHQERLNNS